MIQFKIPLLPQSINSLYKYNFQHRTIYLSNEGRTFKNLVKTYMPPMEYPKESKFFLHIEFHGKWYYKNSKMKRADIQNLIKILVDSIFEKLGMDDSFLWSFCAYKVESDSSYTIVKMDTL